MCARNSNFGTPKSGPVETRPILLVATALLCNYSTQQTAKTTTLFLQCGTYILPTTGKIVVIVDNFSLHEWSEPCMMVFNFIFTIACMQKILS